MADAQDLMFRKSSHSGSGGSCVEVAITPELVAVRDSKDPAGPVLWFTPAEWRAFVNGAVDGEFNLY